MLHNFAATNGYLAYPEKQYTFSVSYHTIWLSDQCGFFDAWYTQADKRVVDHKWQSGSGVRIAEIPAVCGDLKGGVWRGGYSRCLAPEAEGWCVVRYLRGLTSSSCRNTFAK